MTPPSPAALPAATPAALPVATPAALPAASHPALDRLVEQCAGLAPIAMAVVSPAADAALEGAVLAARRKLIEPLFVGPRQAIEALARRLDLPLDPASIVDARDDEDATRKAVALCATGRVRALMKGSLHTDTLMHTVLQPGSGLTTGRRMSHVFVLDAPAYPRLLLITDAAINIYPTLSDKIDIVRNVIDLARAIGIETPRVALLSAVEVVNPKIASTLDAAALCKMADRKQITGAILDGPLAFDTAVSLEAARVKGLSSAVAGVADVLVAPDLESGNMLAKQLEYLGGAELAGVVVGARAPIVLTSRADSARARMVSSALAVLHAHAHVS